MASDSPFHFKQSGDYPHGVFQTVMMLTPGKNKTEAMKNKKYHTGGKLALPVNNVEEQYTAHRVHLTAWIQKKMMSGLTRDSWMQLLKARENDVEHLTLLRRCVSASRAHAFLHRVQVPILGAKKKICWIKEQGMFPKHVPSNIVQGTIHKIHE